MHEPLDALSARRCGERAVVMDVVVMLIEEIGQVQRRNEGRISLESIQFV